MENRMSLGFRAAGIAAGLKKGGEKDLGLIYSDVMARVAGVFTRNLVQAAPVLLDKERIKSGSCQAVIVNSGNANCCTGESGLQHAREMARAAATGLGIPEDLVLVSSTGVIGEPFPIEKVKTAVPNLVEALTSDGIDNFAAAILTTDTYPKIVFRQSNIDGKTFSVTGIAKGAGMICPNMATMLCFICTDVDAKSHLLKDSLKLATAKSLNRITVDGDTSTNDMVLLLANGMSHVVVETADHKTKFQDVLNDVMLSLAKEIVKDGEGATKLIEIEVIGALTEADARKVADTVANSSLVKTAFFGEDANWGRILGAAGRAQVPFEPNRIDVYFNNVMMVKEGMGCGKSAETEATKVLKKSEFKVSIDLHMGDAVASVWTCDFSIDYVKINADYRS
ncbi:bifunctional glutamate N-acetyltransferase/amino-acid acetyltransferase ArgJ [Thermodesulfobacteriota bacterium]